jgi:hypothetical protein
VECNKLFGKKCIIVLNKKEKKMENNIQLSDLSRLSARDLEKLTPDQIDDLRRQYRELLMQNTLSTLTPEQLRFLGYDPENLQGVSEYSLSTNLLKDNEFVKCSRYYTEHPEGVMLFKKNSGNSFNRNQTITQQNGRVTGKYWLKNEILTSLNNLYTMQIFDDGNAILFDNNSAEIWNLKQSYSSFLPLNSFEIRNTIDESVSVEIIELVDNTPTRNKTLLPYMKDSRNTIKSYNTYGVRLNNVGDLVFDALFTEEYPDQTKEYTIIPYFIIPNTQTTSSGTYEFILNNNRTFEIRNSTTLETLYLTKTETNGLLYPIYEDMYETLGIQETESLKTANCSTGSVMTSVKQAKFNINDFKNGDILYDPVIRDFFRVYNYKLGKLPNESIMKSWYYPRTSVKPIQEFYYVMSKNEDKRLIQYTSDVFTLCFFFTSSILDVVLDNHVITLESNKIMIDDNVSSSITNMNSTNLFTWIQNESSWIVYINGKEIMNILIPNKIKQFQNINPKGTTLSSFRLYNIVLNVNDLNEIYKSDIYSPGIEAKVYDTYLFRKGKDYEENREHMLVSTREDLLYYFENDDSILFTYDAQMKTYKRYIQNKLKKETKLKYAIPFTLNFLNDGDLIYDPILQKRFRYYNKNLGELPTIDVLNSWYDDPINDYIIRNPNVIRNKQTEIETFQILPDGLSISFFIQTKPKLTTLFEFQSDKSTLRGGISSNGNLFINDIETSKRIVTDTLYFIVISFLPSGRYDIYVNGARQVMKEGKYPLTLEYTKNYVNNVIDFRMYSRLLTYDEIQQIYYRNINSPMYSSLYIIDSRGFVKGNVYEKIIPDSKFIYIENDKSKTYDAITYQETSTIQSDATPIPFSKFPGIIIPTSTTTSDSSSMSKIQIIAAIILFITFIYVIHKIFKNM